MYVISKEFSFCASHQLAHLPDTHKCARLHGHNYVVTLEVSAGTLDERGFVVDYGEMDAFARYVETFDHRHLNDLVRTPALTTAENLASMFLAEAVNVIKRKGCLIRVCVSETPKTKAWAGPR